MQQNDFFENRPDAHETAPAKPSGTPTANPEEVRDTLKDIHREKSSRKKRRSVWLTALMILFFPLTGIILGGKWLFTKVKITLTTKTIIIFNFLFVLLIAIYIVIVSIVLERYVKNGEVLDNLFLWEFRIISIVLVLGFLVVGTTIGRFVSHTMLRPIRKIIDQIDSITSENLDTRLDPVDSQDELQDLTNQINSMLDSLEDSFEQQAHFVSDASHELKTPLSIIQGYANLLQRWGKDDPVLLEEGIESIARESANMKKIVEQLLWLAKLGDFTVQYSHVEIMQLVENTVNSYKILDLTHKITFEGETEAYIEIDKNLIVEAMRTLIDNAIKYTKEDGEIRITCMSYKDRVEISVIDNGVGISEKDIGHIFDRFYRCDRARREKGSTGLGLTIAKKIIEMMGGIITVESEVGMGSTFKVLLYY